MTNTIIVSEEFRNYIEGLFYETRTRADLIQFMLMNDIKDPQKFEKIHSEYIKFYVQYQLCKQMLEEYYLKPQFKKMTSWNLDFRTKEVTVNAED